MILHSVTPWETLLPRQSRTETRSFSGGFLEGSVTDGAFRITRVISTDPAVYLDPRWSPGQPFSGPEDHFI